MNPFPSKAMLLAAGFGERLRPLTLTTPKPLIEVAGHRLIEYNLRLLKKFGAQEILINLHHLAEKIKETLGNGKKYGVKLHYHFEPEILGTGGGIKAVESFFGDRPFFVMNADVLIDLNLQEIWKQHQQSGALATLVVSPAERKDVKRLVYLNPKNQILSITDTPPAPGIHGYIFTGVQVIEPKVLEELPAQKKSCIVSNAYLPLLQKNEKLNGFICKAYFRDLGTPERYAEVQKEFAKAWPYTNLKTEDFSSSSI